MLKTDKTKFAINLGKGIILDPAVECTVINETIILKAAIQRKQASKYALITMQQEQGGEENEKEINLTQFTVESFPSIYRNLVTQLRLYRGANDRKDGSMYDTTELDDGAFLQFSHWPNFLGDSIVGWPIVKLKKPTSSEENNDSDTIALIQLHNFDPSKDPFLVIEFNNMCLADIPYKCRIPLEALYLYPGSNDSHDGSDWDTSSLEEQDVLRINRWPPFNSQKRTKTTKKKQDNNPSLRKMILKGYKAISNEKTETQRIFCSKLDPVNKQQEEEKKEEVLCFGVILTPEQTVLTETTTESTNITQENTGAREFDSATTSVVETSITDPATITILSKTGTVATATITPTSTSLLSFINDMKKEQPCVTEPILQEFLVLIIGDRVDTERMAQIQGCIDVNEGEFPSICCPFLQLRLQRILSYSQEFPTYFIPTKKGVIVNITAGIEDVSPDVLFRSDLVFHFAKKDNNDNNNNNNLEQKEKHKVILIAGEQKSTTRDTLASELTRKYFVVLQTYHKYPSFRLLKSADQIYFFTNKQTEEEQL